MGFQQGSFYLEQASERENVVLLQHLLREQFGQPVEFAVKSLAPDVAPTQRSLAQDRDIAREEAKAELARKVKQHPAVAKATEILGGEVQTVTPLVSEHS